MALGKNIVYLTDLIPYWRDNSFTTELISCTGEEHAVLQRSLSVLGIHFFTIELVCCTGEEHLRVQSTQLPHCRGSFFTREIIGRTG